VDSECAAIGVVAGAGAFGCLGILGAPVSERVFGCDRAGWSHTRRKSRGHSELDASRTAETGRIEPDRFGNTQPGKHPELPRLIVGLRYSDECVFESGAKFRPAGATAAAADTRPEYETRGSGSAPERTVGGGRPDVPGDSAQSRWRNGHTQRTEESANVCRSDRKGARLSDGIQLSKLCARARGAIADARVASTPIAGSCFSRLGREAGLEPVVGAGIIFRTDPVGVDNADSVFTQADYGLVRRPKVEDPEVSPARQPGTSRGSVSCIA